MFIEVGNNRFVWLVQIDIEKISVSQATAPMYPYVVWGKTYLDKDYILGFFDDEKSARSFVLSLPTSQKILNVYGCFAPTS